MCDMFPYMFNQNQLTGRYIYHFDEWYCFLYSILIAVGTDLGRIQPRYIQSHKV